MSTTPTERAAIIIDASVILQGWDIPTTSSELKQATDWVIKKWEARGFTPKPRAVAVVLRREHRIRQ